MAIASNQIGRSVNAGLLNTISSQLSQLLGMKHHTTTTSTTHSTTTTTTSSTSTTTTTTTIPVTTTTTTTVANALAKVGSGEYWTGYLGSNGRVYNTQWISNNPQVIDYGLTSVLEIDGGQYTGLACNSSGQVYMLSNVATLVSLDNANNPFTGNSKVYGWFTWNLSIRTGGTVWIWGYNQTGSGVNFLGLNNHEGNPIVKPIQLGQPSGKTITKLTLVRFGAPTIYGLASDGTVWQWVSNTTPTQVPFTGTASDIVSIGSGVCVIITGTDILAFGTYASYVGLSNMTTTPTSIKNTWTSAGVTLPLIKVIGNYNTLQIIDANHDRYTCGSNVCGEFGNGSEYNPYRTRVTLPWLWNLNSGELVTPIQKQLGKWSDVYGGITFAFYVYGKDMGNNWYSWGRNKALCLGNGTTLSINDYANYPNNLDIVGPELITPLSQIWNVISPNTGAIQPPQSNAGINQYISSSSTTLDGLASGQQEGVLTNYLWTKISGTGGHITSPTSSITTVTGLTTGTYVFRLTVTNNLTLNDSSIITVVVS